jgi:hypothetical protein
MSMATFTSRRGFSDGHLGDGCARHLELEPAQCFSRNVEPPPRCIVSFERSCHCCSVLNASLAPPHRANSMPFVLHLRRCSNRGLNLALRQELSSMLERERLYKTMKVYAKLLAMIRPISLEHPSM